MPSTCSLLDRFVGSHIMEGVSTELVNLLRYLLPGFLAAWIFYGLTAHPKAAQFERVVQAVIFTAIIQWVVLVIKWCLCFLGRHCVIWGTWNPDSTVFWSMLVAVAMGLLFARFANDNSLHEWLWCWKWYEKQRLKSRRNWQRQWIRSRRRFRLPSLCPLKWSSFRKSGFLRLLRLKIRRVLGIPKFVHLPKWQWTSRTSYPSEWYSTFSQESRNVILHLVGKRRLLGWPYEWPDQPEKGQFVIQNPRWLLSNGKTATLYGVAKMLVPASQVEMVEFVKYDDEITEDEAAEMTNVQELLVQEQTEGDQNVSEVPTKPEPTGSCGGENLPSG